MRREPVTTEALFWSFVRNRKLDGFKFRRQVPIGPYIVDFVCIERKLIVELDGPFHAGRKGYDRSRDTYLEGLGYQVLRFPNVEVAGDWPVVLATVKHELETRAPSP